MYKILIITTLLIGAFNKTHSQEVTIEIEKNKYKFDEIIEVKYMIEFKEDSLILPEFHGLSIIGGPSTSNSTSIINGTIKRTKSWAYSLRPLNSGKISIESPVFFVNGKKMTGRTKHIIILDNQLSELELQEIKYKSFVEDLYKPAGTYRYVLNEEFGYIEIFKDSKWHFHRKLTTEECKQLRKVK